MQKERWDIGWDDKEALYVREIIDDVFVTVFPIASSPLIITLINLLLPLQTITMGEVVCIRRFKRI